MTTEHSTFSCFLPQKHSIPQSLSKLQQKMYKNFENWKNLGFLSLSVPILAIDFFNRKTAINSLEKFFGQQILSLLTLFNFPFHEDCRKIDKNCIKTSKNRKFLVFAIFCVNLRSFSFGKQLLALRKSLLDNNYMLVERFLHFYPRYLSKN